MKKDLFGVKKGVSLLVIMVLLVAIAVACSSNNSATNGSSASVDPSAVPADSKSPAPTETPAPPAEPTKISMMAPLYLPQPPVTDDRNPAFKAIEELTHTKLEVTLVPSATYDDKFNVTLASGAMPQVMVSLKNKDSAVINAIRAGAFWEIGPYIQEFPNIASYWNEDIANNVKVDGKVYGLYRERPIARNGFVFRQDWLDNLGLTPPKNLDELYAVLKAFTYDDPDKNGKDDTYGVTTTEGNINGFIGQLNVGGGGINGWGLEDGKLVPEFSTQNYMDTLKFVAKLYNEKLINQDFAVINGTQLYEPFNKGQSGMFFSVVDDGPGKTADLFKLNPSAVVDMRIGFETVGGIKTSATAGYLGSFMFPKSSVKTEEDLKKILAYFDRALDKDLTMIFAWGAEGVHHKLDSGNPVWIDEQLYRDQVDNLQQLRIAPVYVWPNDSPLVKRFKQLFEDHKKDVVVNFGEPFVSQTMTERGSDLNKLMNDARIQFVMGKIDESGYNKVLEDWRKRGGDAIIEEFNQEYNKVKR